MEKLVKLEINWLNRKFGSTWKNWLNGKTV